MDEIVLTIAIPTYQRPKYLTHAINSAINQKTHSLKYEILVINNDPSSDLSDIVNVYSYSNVPIRFISNKINLGMVGNVNKCVLEAKGKYIAFLHDDDLLLPNYISEIEKILLEKEISCLIPKRFLYFDGENNSQFEKKRKKKQSIGRLIKYVGKKRDLIELNIVDNIYAWTNCYCAPSCGVVFLKKDVIDTELFFPDTTLSWDFISFLKLNQEKRIFIYDKVLSVYRISVGLTQKATTQFDFYQAYDSFLSYAKENKICNEFISRYYRYLKYLNYKSLTEEGAKLVADHYDDIVTYPDNKVKYLVLMVKRMIYFYKNHLDIELIIDKDTQAYIKKIEEVKR